MNKDLSNGTNSNEEVDLIRLLDYFKNGIKSIFRTLWQIVEILLRLIVLIKKNWLIVLGLAIVGATVGFYFHFTKPKVNSYELVLHSNPISNIELYALASELNKSDDINKKSEGANLLKKLGVRNLNVEPIEREGDIVNAYFNQIETATLRNDLTDTLYFQNTEIGEFKSKMKKEDYVLQKLKLEINSDSYPSKVQENLLYYFNNLPGPKAERERNLAVLNSYEKILMRNIENIDTILASRASLNNSSGSAVTEQLLVNTASRGNVEADLLRYSETLSKKLYGTQKKISEYEEGVFVVSNLRLIDEYSISRSPIIKYTLYGLLLGIFIIIVLQLNKYLSRYDLHS